MKKRWITFCMAAIMLMLTACGGRGGNSMAGMDAATGSYGGDRGYMEEATNAGLPMAQESLATKGDNPIYQNPDAKLIRRAELTIQTTEFVQAVNALDELVLSRGGYFENAYVYGGSYRNAHANRSGEYVVRIPAERYEDFKSSTGELGYVVRSSQSSENVGEQYYDTEARLKTQRTKQERLLKLLEQAATMEDIIDLENALSDVEYEIEQLSSTLNRYDALISYSTFTIYLEEVAKVTEEVGETASLGQKMAAGVQSSLDDLINGCQGLLIWLSYNIFMLVIVIGVVTAGGVAGVRRMKKAAAKRNEKTDEKGE